MAKEDQIQEYRFDKRTPEEQREIARQGGIASGKVRKEKATMKDTLEMLLNSTSKSGQTYKELVTLGLLKGAINGNAQNYRTILETLGQLKQAQEDRTHYELTKVEELLGKIENEAQK